MRQWLEQHHGTDRVTGSRTADMRSALVDYFREQGRIMIATEAGAEGINLQFCSLVVNYDLPGTRSASSSASAAVIAMARSTTWSWSTSSTAKTKPTSASTSFSSEKFKLFEGVFGASDEVLGAIESGVDFEKRIADIYQHCRKHEEIKAAFDQLQLELSLGNQRGVDAAHASKLLEHFDDEVREKLKLERRSARKSTSTSFERLLMRLTRHELDGCAEFLERFVPSA